MVSITCPICEKEISLKEQICPHCGGDIRVKVGKTEAITTTLNDEKANKNRGGGIVVIIILLVCVIWLGSLGDSSPVQTKERTEHTVTEAFHHCRNFVQQQLLSPKTASFPSIWDVKDYTTHLGGGRYRVRAYVDAQNAFGAEIRTPFVCIVKYEGKYSWRLESLEM
ncbi:hypothetical protein ATY35_20680 [Vibrio cidicii]|uniref:Zinc ribbon domain-containing protein n=1 Tax=Vibrio cidicii TaxID=1763883 RepID=A0ABR5W8G1_9VIBR|nr:zinc ribbon domain-containing protein [Vibrio cidicii]KYN90801.1 hypothetical protein ATY35_20680 [Vibrio cidicii]